MEDKLPTKESHVWTLSDFIERRKDWDQKDEARLVEYLQQLSNKIIHGAKNTLNELNDLVTSVDNTAVQIANINNEFQLLADKQFIENRVQEEDETVQIKVEKPVAHKINNSDALENNLKEALKNSFIAIDTHFEKITVAVSDSDDDDELQHEETVLRPRTFYKKLNLPSLSGTQSDIGIDIVMYSDSESDTDVHINTLKDKESSSSNDVLQEDIHSIVESKNIHELNPQPIDTCSNIFESEKNKPKNVPMYADNSEDDLFSPPPLINDDEEDLDHEYNIFGNGNSNMYGERNLWDDNDDDDLSNEPPLPIYSDEPPLQFIKSDTQENTIQQSLNEELRKRFQKDNISSSSDNVNVESPKIQLPKESDIIGRTDIKPSLLGPSQNKHGTFTQISKNVPVTIQNNDDDINKDLNISKKLLDNSSQNAIAHKDLKKETKSIKNHSLFEQDSDDDLFAEKKPYVIPTSKPEIVKQKENLSKNLKLSRPIFSESDSDEEFFNSKSSISKEIASRSIDNNTTRLIDSSSDDDLFNIKSNNNKSLLKQNTVSFSSQVHDTVNEPKKINNEIKENSKFLMEEENVREILNKTIIDESENNSEVPSVKADNAVEKEFLPNNNNLNSNIIEPPSTDTIIQINKKSSNSSSTNKFSNLFSSDEDDLDDDIFLNVNESNKKIIKKDQKISNSTKLVTNKNDDIYRSKVDMFDSSSDDDIFQFSTDKSSYLISTENNKQAVSKEIKSREPQLNDNCVITNQIPKIENNINVIEKNQVDKKSTNVFNLLSDDEEDENYLSFNNNSDSSMNFSISQNENENKKATSSSSEEFFSPQIDIKNDLFQALSPESLLDNKVQKSLKKNETDKSKNETSNIFEDKKMHSNISSMFSSYDDEQQLSFNTNIQIKNSETGSEVISSSSNSSFENVNDFKNQEPFNENEQIASSIKEKLPILTETKIQDIKSSIFSSNDKHLLLFNSNNLNESSIKEIKVIHPISNVNTYSEELLKDSIDGSSFSSLSSNNDTVKKIPGKLNKNAGAFINIAGLLPNSKTPLKASNISPSASIDVNTHDDLPTSGAKLFSVEKERAKIQVKRRPQSRKARLAAARLSSIDIDHGSNIQESSRLFSSTSDLVNYQNSPILDDVLDFSKQVQATLNNKLPVINNETKTNNESKKNIILDLYDDGSDLFESCQEEKTRKNDCTDKEKKLLDENQFVSKPVCKELPEIDPIHKKLLKNEPSNQKKTEIETESIYKKQDEPVNMIEIEENKSKLIIQNSQNTRLSNKSNDLFDDDNDDIFSSKYEKVNKLSSNIFDSDDELEFNKPFTKKTSIKTTSIFGDDSDDDLFNSSSKPSTSNLPSHKPIDKISHQKNRPCADGYVKLTAESVAINPLESKKN